ncbi:cation:proton antiporter [Streptomyces albidus (ex Kaewkla and Franco 2022)]|uniref:cation:proton antiporter n=1 Tax=Streptomyces albidus (ex Kaewkla and Franco 2022) TaxID=722709 RepID=UPI0015EF252F|nr:cation:proton antiporter [Streptomyces albidus (ex Kaewkla and Franco 2022)]
MPSDVAPIPPLPAHQLLVFLLQVGLLVLLAVVCGRLATRLRMPAVTGELCVGILLGPTVLGNTAPALAEWLLPRSASQFHLLDALGQIGVVLLVGVTGMEMDTRLVRRRGTAALSVGLGGLLLPLALGFAAGWAAPGSLIPESSDRLVFALFIAVALCVSALPVIAKTLTDMNLIHRNVGQLTLAAGMVDDIIGWILLSVVSAMAVGEADTTSVAAPLAATALVLACTFLIVRPLVRRGMRAAERSGESATTVAGATALILLSAAATHALGLEAMFGAFLAGMLIASGSHSVRARLAPLRTVVLSVLAPLFFATAGLRVELGALTHPQVLAAAAALLVIAVVGKVAGAYFGARVAGIGPWESLALGGGLNARGVIQLVIATVGLRIGVLTPTAYTLIVLVAIATSLMAPPLLRFAMRRVEQTMEEELRLRDCSFVPEKPSGRTPDAQV